MENDKTKKVSSSTRGKRRFLKRFRRDEEGATAIEFALLMPLFIWLLFGTLELFVNATYNRMLANAMLEVERVVKTGQVTGTTSKEDFKQNVVCGTDGIGRSFSMFDCSKIYVDVQQVDNFRTPDNFEKSDDGGFDSSNFDFAPGGRQTINIVRIFYEMPSITGMTNMLDTSGNKYFVNNKRVLGASAAFWIEP